MKTLITRDLFPETLLVNRNGDRIYTTSLRVAQFSARRHSNVLQAIDNKLKLLLASFNELNFKLVEYKDAKGELRKMYELTEEGFALTMMGFTGKTVLQWQVAFIEAFMAQRLELAQLQAKHTQVLQSIRPCLLPVVNDTTNGMPRAVIAQRLGKSAASVSYHRAQARKYGLLPQRGQA